MKSELSAQNNIDSPVNRTKDDYLAPTLKIFGTATILTKGFQTSGSNIDGIDYCESVPGSNPEEGCGYTS